MRHPLQNRVDPYGGIHAVAARGTLMGNRGGCLHDDHRQLGRRRWVSKRWIACVLTFKERHRTVMAPGRYTELFFLDEATALATGHRPCFECRRQDAKAFSAAWARASALRQWPRADTMDTRLHAERMVSRREVNPVPLVRPADLPSGTMVARQHQNREKAAWLVLHDRLRRWSFSGYTDTLPIASVDSAELITPPCVVDVLRSGYHAQIHPSTWGG